MSGASTVLIGSISKQAEQIMMSKTVCNTTLHQLLDLDSGPAQFRVPISFEDNCHVVACIHLFLPSCFGPGVLSQEQKVRHNFYQPAPTSHFLRQGLTTQHISPRTMWEFTKILYHSFSRARVIHMYYYAQQRNSLKMQCMAVLPTCMSVHSYNTNEQKQNK